MKGNNAENESWKQKQEGAQRLETGVLIKQERNHKGKSRLKGRNNEKHDSFDHTHGRTKGLQ